MKQRRGFTLIELLVVITIITILIAILLPALSAARRAAQSAQCLSNLHQVAIGVAAYSTDSDGYGPPSGYSSDYAENTGANYYHCGWSGNLSVYLFPDFKSGVHNRATAHTFYSTKGSIFICPSDLQGHNHLFGGDPDATKTYLANTLILGSRSSTNTFPHAGVAYWWGTKQGPMRLSSVHQASDTYLIIEQWESNGTRYEISNPVDDNKVSPHFAGDFLIPVHDGGRHYLYVDGHAAVVKDPSSQPVSHTDSAWHADRYNPRR